jgi:hypothetical protein
MLVIQVEPQKCPSFIVRLILSCCEGFYVRPNGALKLPRRCSLSGARSRTPTIGKRVSRLERGKTMLPPFGSISSTNGFAWLLELISDALGPCHGSRCIVAPIFLSG